MSEVEPACRFCQRHMDLVSRFNPPAEDLEASSIYGYQCKSCRSHQTYSSSGRPIDWNFEVGGQYILYFFPSAKGFYIGKLTAGHFEKYIVYLHDVVVPIHMTPQNTTIERVKTLILFS